MTTTLNTRDTNTTSFVFNSKFEKLLNDENRQPITAAFEKFCKMPADVALTTLWRLTYDEVIASEIVEDLGLTQEMISSENRRKFRDELRKQYEKLHKGFLTANVSEECKEMFETLVKKTDPIIAAIINRHCSYRLYEIDVERALFLLNSDREAYYFGGIRELAFDKEEAAFLKPFHEQIHDLLKVMYEHKKEFESTFANTPFQGLAERLEDAGIELPFDIVEDDGEAPVETPADVPAKNATEPVLKPAAEAAAAEQPVQPTSQFEGLTLEAIKAHKDVFASFVQNSDLNILVQLGNLGFDLNEVVAKKDKIGNILKAIDRTVKAEADLIKAAEKKQKAEEKLLKLAESLSN